jgi:hypothetical protein
MTKNEKIFDPFDKPRREPEEVLESMRTRRKALEAKSAKAILEALPKLNRSTQDKLLRLMNTGFWGQRMTHLYITGTETDRERVRAILKEELNFDLPSWADAQETNVIWPDD